MTTHLLILGLLGLFIAGWGFNAMKLRDKRFRAFGELLWVAGVGMTIIAMAVAWRR